MKSKHVLVAAVALSSTAATAQLTGYDEWPMAAAGQLLTAIGIHDQKLFDRIVSPGAIYFANYHAEQAKQSTPLSLDALANVKDRCQVSSIEHCSATIATIEWFCPKAPKKDRNVWSHVHVDQSGRIISVTSESGPMVCVTSAPIQGGTL